MIERGWKLVVYHARRSGEVGRFVLSWQGRWGRSAPKSNPLLDCYIAKSKPLLFKGPAIPFRTYQIPLPLDRPIKHLNPNL